jgi:hypothetical protein
MKLNDDTMDFTGVELTVRRTELEAKSVLQKLGTVYDQHAKLVFLFDVSGSMSSRIAKTYTDQYEWPVEKLTEIRKLVAAATAKANRIMATVPDLNVIDFEEQENLSVMEQELLKLTESTRGPNGELSFAPKDDEDLKERVVTHDLIGMLEIGVNWARHDEQPPTRLDVVKRLAKSEIQARFKKFPKSAVAVIPFGDQSSVMFDEGKPEQLWPALDSLTTCWRNPDTDEYCGGGTCILAAISRAIEVCRVKPSAVGVHHLIVVSDGEDNVYALRNWVPNLKASGVVLDYIHIGDRCVNDELVEACKALGGESVTVNSVKDFEKKFVEAIQRRMLPPAA